MKRTRIAVALLASIAGALEVRLAGVTVG